LHDCDIPLRLRRRHYIDFTVDFEEALKVLFKALALEGPIDLEAIARQFHEGTIRPLVVRPPFQLMKKREE
jgi:hypothetical protein